MADRRPGRGWPRGYAAVDLIRAKRDGAALTGDEIRWLIGAYLSGEVAEEQMSALLMAVYFRGLDADRAAQLDLGDGGLRRAAGPAAA